MVLLHNHSASPRKLGAVRIAKVGAGVHARAAQPGKLRSCELLLSYPNEGRPGQACSPRSCDLRPDASI